MRLAPLLLSILLALPAAIASAQNFSPAITVDNKVVTVFELEQRRKLLELFRTPGNLDELAREQLIDDRLKQIALDRAGLSITPEALANEVEAFAGRANLTAEQFTTILAQNGVAYETLEEFVRMGVSWRDYIRSRYGNSVTITAADIDRALGQSGAGADGIEVLLSEIIIPAPPPQAARANALASQIAQTTSEAQFSSFARQHSALPSRNNGGRLGWLPISNYPPQLQGLLLGLSPGEVTAPIGITGGVALFQMRGVREVASAPSAPTSIEYAAYYIPGAGTDAGRAAAARLALDVDVCDDLYGAAQGQAPEVLERNERAPSEIPQDIALELARLDRGEVSYNVTRGNNIVFLMLCNRQSSEDTGDRTAVAEQLRSQRLAGLANALLEELRSSANING